MGGGGLVWYGIGIAIGIARHAAAPGRARTILPRLGILHARLEHIGGAAQHCDSARYVFTFTLHCVSWWRGVPSVSVLLSSCHGAPWGVRDGACRLPPRR